MRAVVDNQKIRKLLRSYPTEAVKILYDFYYKSLLNIARALTYDPIASEDIVQEAFLIVLLNRVELSEHHERSIEHYLVKVVRNRSVSYYKKRKLLSLDNLILQTSHHREPSAESNIIEAEAEQEIRLMIGTFPKREKECLLMKIDEDMTPDQIAARLNISRKAVERSITSAKKRLSRRASGNRFKINPGPDIGKTDL